MSYQQTAQSYLKKVEAYLDTCLPKEGLDQQQVADAMRYSLMAGGKRIRAMLVLETARCCGLPEEQALPFAAAVEMVHAYSLIHDDLPCMDDDDMRRGKPSCHIQFGEATALLAGDGLQSRAFEILTEKGLELLPPDRVALAARELSSAIGIYGMLGGQMLDLLNDGKAIGEGTLHQINALKTGALIRASAKLGVIAAGGREEVLQAADQYARQIGLAFQIVDDILDCTGDAARLGKPIGSDAENHKVTYAALYGIAGAYERAGELTRKAREAIRGTELDGEFLNTLAEELLDRDH